jgi:WD40 repeat protein
VRPLVGHKGPVLSVTYSPDGRVIASGGQDADVRFWESATGRWLRTVHNRQPTPALAYHPRGIALALSSPYSGARVYTPSGTPEFEQDHLPNPPDLWSGSVSHLAFSPDGRFLVARFTYSSLLPDQPPGRLTVFWEFVRRPKGWAVERFASREDPPANAVAVAPTRTGAWAALIGTDDGLWVWTLDEQARPLPWQQKLGKVSAVACHVESKQAAAVVGADVVLLPLRKEPGPGVVCRGRGDEVRAVAFAPDGRTVLTGGADGLVILWDVVTGTELVRFDWGTGPVNALAVAPDGLTAAAAGDAGLVAFDLG